MSESKKKYIILAMLLLFVFLGIMAFIGNRNRTRQVKSDAYRLISDIEGVAFEVPSDLANSATALSQISDNTGLSEAQTYCYRNGNDIYMLFNMSTYIICVQKGTSFSLDEYKTPAASFQNNSLNGIWFSPIANGTTSEKDGKWIVDAFGQVSITKRLYNDYYGKVATVVNEGTEYSLFIGSLSKYHDASEEIFNYVIDSFHTVELIPESERTRYMVDMNTGEKLVADEAGNIMTLAEYEERQAQLAAQAESSDDTSGEEDEEQTDKVIITAGDSTYIQSDAIAYTSSVYSMLEPGEIGMTKIISDFTGNNSPAYVKITRLYDKEETDEIVNQYVTSGKAYFDSFNVPTGSHLEAVRYKIHYTTNDGSYLSVQMTGLDGKELVYNGVTYSERTYHTQEQFEAEGNWIDNNIVFYLVPDGCPEYALKFGGVGVDGLREAAWFYICK